MVFALNIFNLVDSKENYYREYSVKAGKIIYSKKVAELYLQRVTP